MKPNTKSEPAQTAGNAPEPKLCPNCGSDKRDERLPVDVDGSIFDHDCSHSWHGVEPAPSPATKETPPTLSEAVKLARESWQAIHGKCSPCAIGDVPVNGLHRGVHKCGNFNSPTETEVKSSSQGPAREETPPTARKSYEKWVREIRHEEDIEEYAPMGWTVWQAAFGAGAKSVVAAPQIEISQLIEAVNQRTIESQRWAKRWQEEKERADKLAVAQSKRGDPEIGRTGDEDHRPLVCYVCGGRFGITFNFCHEHKAHYEALAGAAALPSPEYEAELNQERLVSAVMCGLEEMNLRCSHDAAVQWFQEGYREAIAKLKLADECGIFEIRKGKPTLTGRELPSPPVPSKEPK